MPTLALINEAEERGIEGAVLIMRHSAREYVAGRNDLENPLTAAGRTFSRALGGRLPRGYTLRGYASPPDRCMETAELILAGFSEAGGQVTRHRPVEALGVFYALDQQKFWKGLDVAGGLDAYADEWVSGRVPRDAMMPSEMAASMILRVLAEKLKQPVAERQLDVCVSHDITLHLLRRELLGETSPLEVNYLDGLILFEESGALKLRSHTGIEASVRA